MSSETDQVFADAADNMLETLGRETVLIINEQTYELLAIIKRDETAAYAMDGVFQNETAFAIKQGAIDPLPVENQDMIYNGRKYRVGVVGNNRGLTEIELNRYGS